MTATVDHAQRAHAILSASSAHRWLVCTPSARLEEQEPDTTSPYAEEGTFAHELAEIELRKQVLGEPARRPRGYRDNEHYAPAMEEHLAEYVTIVQERVSEHRKHTPDPLILLEQRLDYSRWVPEGFGTGDVVIVSDMGIEVIDLKYGRGVPEYADGNEQLRLYALGAYDAQSILYDINHVYMTIVQPRLDSVSKDDMPASELLAWAEREVKPRAKLAWAGEGEFVAGDHCRFCKIKSTCRSRAEANLELAKHEFAEPETLDHDEIAGMLGQIDELVRWASDVKKYALHRAVNHGDKFNGWKLVEGRSNRRYSDEKAIATTLTSNGFSGEQIYRPLQLITLTNMERLLGKKRFAELIGEYVDKPPGKPALVPESDKRPEISTTESAAEDFADQSYCRDCIDGRPCALHDV